MALFEDEELDEDELLEEPNKYLDNSELGISLIKSMLDRHKQTENIEKIDEIIDAKILPILAELELNNSLDIYRKLKRIADRIREQKKIQLLERKKILGVGGKFSAGKSCFINSISGAKLPEGQRPTTSIATYIVNSDETRNSAITSNDNMIELDDEAVAALTHQFYDKYQIGFSRLVKNLIIYSSEFKYKNIAILDTPGYSKSDESKADDASDAELAREQLKMVDYLIWLVDAVQGVITQRDIEFISSLKIDSEILVVYTKADCEESSNLNKKVLAAKEVLESVNKKIYDVIAYDSVLGETIIGGESLQNYLNKIDKSVNNIVGIDLEVENIRADLKSQLDNQLEQTNKKIVEYDTVLENVVEVEHISSIINEKSILKNEGMSIIDNREKLNTYFIELIRTIRNMRVVK